MFSAFPGSVVWYLANSQSLLFQLFVLFFFFFLLRMYPHYIYVTPFCRWCAEDKRNTAWVVEEGSYKYQLQPCN